ncbi:MAG: endopeptidase La, partial [Elusimicrobia bacterium]|nr:endopeptidase La [Elusimicrobiota bacterium]
VFERYARLSRRVAIESLAPLAQIEDLSRLVDTIAAAAITKVPERQALLELFDPRARAKRLIALLNGEIDILNLEKKIHSQVRTQIEKTQKEYYLTEQMKAIQKELRQKDDFGKEIEELREKIKAAKMSKTAEEAAMKDLGRLEKMMPFSPESTVCRTYLDWMIGLPWSKETKDNLDLKRAGKILDDDHYGLEKPKERILEYLAVCKLTRKLKGPILCFVGPPGVGKTSLGRSIAEAVGRKFVRLSLGGVRDEAEIRGHRRTYIGSLPGRIIQSLRKAQSRNPVFLLDEIDKMGMDWRGDPAAALLEVLDPEQNATFMDHYLDVEFDLSNILFICTANTLEGIPVSLQDRLEILRFAGYTHREKMSIARNHLIPKQLKDHGLKAATVQIADAAIERVINEYTREAGVRSLEREIGGLSRKAARKLVAEKADKLVIDAPQVPSFLGIPKHHYEKHENELGVATGLAWTEHGGEILAIEVVSTPGKGTVTLTGKLGSVMQESAHAALSYIKSVAKWLGIPATHFRRHDFHVHIPEGAIPKDGPSAGITLATALASQLSGRAVRTGVAMTGEITLRGRVLAIGGLKEKVMAAHREGLRVVLFPFGNTKDLEDIPKDVLAQVEMVPVRHVSEVFARALMPAAGRQARGVKGQALPATPLAPQLTPLPRPGAA